MGGRKDDGAGVEQSGSGFASADVERRKAWLEFGADDEALIEEIDSVLKPHLQGLITNMYDHFLSFEETRAFFPDETTLNRARSAQLKYFERLTQGGYDTEYVRDRLRVGSTHHRIDLDPKWYMGAYSHVVSYMLPHLFERFGADSDKLRRAVAAILKLIFFDMGLAIETYISAKEASIRKHRDIIAELETERRVTRSLLESSPIGMVRLDEALSVVECNDEFLKMVGQDSGEQALGRNLFELCPHLVRQPFENVLSTGASFQSTAEELNFSGAHSVSKGYWDWATWPMKNAAGQSVGLLAIFVSASDRVRLQQQREDFVATLTHDLKTPILAANRAVKLLIEGDFGAVSEGQAGILETIHQSNESLYKLVQTLLDVYRYDSGAKRLRIASHDLKDIVNRLVSELSPLAQAKSITIVADLPDQVSDVLCDQEEIRRVVQNLLDNSLKFTPAGGSIRVSLRQDEDETTITIIDTGKGIRDEDMPKLFQRFWQASSSGRYYASTGLGLYLCRKIVELHGGQIWCQSVVGTGSTFAFSIRNESRAKEPAQTDIAADID